MDYVDSLQMRLSALRLSVLDAREGILESYVVTNRKAAKAGLTEIAVDAEDNEVLEQLRNIMSDLFAERGGNFESPSVRELRSIRHTMDLRLRFNELPPEISETHDMVCEILLEKTGEPKGVEGIVEPQPVEEPLEPVKESTPEPQPVEPEAQKVGEILPESFSPKVSEPEGPFAASLTARLAMDILSPQDARDGLIECFVASYRKTFPKGSQTPDAIASSEGRFEARVRKMMREFFTSEGASFDEPPVELLESAKSYLEHRLGIQGLPGGILAEHNKICTELIAKARRFLEGVMEEIPRPAVFEPATPPEVKTVEAAPPEPVVAEVEKPAQVEPLEAVVPEPLQEPPREEVPQVPSVEEIIARVREEIRQVVKEEMGRSIPPAPKPAVQLQPPSGIAAQVAGQTVFLAWFDQPDQPSYHVYKREGDEWLRLTAAPIARPSFRVQVDAEGELAFAVTSVSAEGKESERSEEVRVRV